MIKKTVTKKDLSHARIVAAASKTMRRSGFNDVSVAEVMKEAGLTHGGFYAHFQSRDVLLAEAVTHAGIESRARIGSHVDSLHQKGSDKFQSLVNTYLSEEHAGDCENGCPVAGLCGDMPHQSSVILDSSRQTIKGLHKLVQDSLPEFRGSEASDAAWALAGMLIGVLQMARAIGGKQGRSILAAGRADILARYCH